MPSKKKTIEILETFKNYVLSNDSIPDDSDDEPIEAVKTNAKPVVKQAPKQIEPKVEIKQEPKDEVKPETPKGITSKKQVFSDETVAQKNLGTMQGKAFKRIQSEAQKLNTQKMREKLAEAQKRRAEEKAEREAMERAILDEKIVKKAISIKKKQIKKEKVLDEISDDETPMEEIVKKIRPTKAPEVKPPVPVYAQPAPPKFTLKFHK
mgnify:CR=1 FL=1